MAYEPPILTLQGEVVGQRRDRGLGARGQRLRGRALAGGGAGGLQLAARLGHRLGPDSPIELTLIDAALTHVWKPQLHELAAGTLAVVPAWCALGVIHATDPNGHQWLLPRNPDYAPIPGDEATIMGKVVTVLRSL